MLADGFCWFDFYRVAILLFGGPTGAEAPSFFLASDAAIKRRSSTVLVDLLPLTLSHWAASHLRLLTLLSLRPGRRRRLLRSGSRSSGLSYLLRFLLRLRAGWSWGLLCVRLLCGRIRAWRCWDCRRGFLALARVEDCFPDAICIWRAGRPPYTFPWSRGTLSLPLLPGSLCRPSRCRSCLGCRGTLRW